MHIAQFWDGRAPTVEEQAKGPILAGGEMAMPSAEAVVKKLNGIEGYEALFEAAFPKSSPAITYDNVGNAIGAYERLFVTPAKFDKALAGDASVLSEKEKRGLKTFVTTDASLVIPAIYWAETCIKSLGWFSYGQTRRIRGGSASPKRNRTRCSSRCPA